MSEKQTEEVLELLRTQNNVKLDGSSLTSGVAFLERASSSLEYGPSSAAS
jgi:hypothetical protein